jgi:hypothetical protein
MDPYIEVDGSPRHHVSNGCVTCRRGAFDDHTARDPVARIARGSVTSSSLLAWITSAVPPSWKTEFGLPFSSVMSLLTTVSVRLPFAGS